MRPRCDPVDAAAIRLAIERGETNERAAYRAYAATAARPYARSSFTIMLKARQSDIGALRVHRIFDPAGDGTTYWRDRTPIKPPILAVAVNTRRMLCEYCEMGWRVAMKRSDCGRLRGKY
jgi:hypothetical protein